MPFSFDDDLAYEQRTLVAVWARQAAARGDESFVWADGRWRTWREIDRRARALAARLADRGLRRGDRVSLLMGNSPEMLVALLAIWRRGLVAVPVSPQLIGELLGHRLHAVRAKAVISDPECLEALRAAAGAEPPWFTLANRAEPEAEDAMEPARAAPREADDVAVEPSDPALVLFTSGSTGVAKGCVFSHHYSVYYAWVFWRYMGYRADDTLHTCLPLNHCHALFASWWPSVLAGGRLALGRRFSATQYWQEVTESEATVCSAIGMMTSILLSQPTSDWEGRHSVRLAHVSADSAATMPGFQQRFGVRAVTSRYGSTEAMVFPPMVDMPPTLGLIGPAPRDFDVMLVDAEGRDVGDGVGELLVRPRIPHTMFDGYDGMPEATLAAFRGLWFHTGDLVRRDAAGLYWFVGRVSDTIRRRGENVSAWEVERAIGKHPSVEQVAAIGVPSELSGEEIGVVVVPRADASLTEQELAEFAERVLPRYMRPDRIWLREDGLPTTASDKIDKDPLRAEYVAGGWADGVRS